MSAALVLGSVFGTAIARVGYQGVDASVLTLLCALVSGFSLLTLLLKKETCSQLVLLARQKCLAGCGRQTSSH